MKTVAAFLTLLMVSAALPALLAPAPAVAATDRREMQARQAFAAGRYREALDLFVTLYAEKLHPNYLRNIARCYQDLGEPDKAIDSFHEYLRKAKDLSDDERKEIAGYIAEMEALKKRQQEAPPPAPVAAPAPAAVAQAPVAAPPPPAPPPAAAPPAPPLVVMMAPPPPAPEAPPKDQETPVYGRWWFWAIVGGVIVAGLGGAAAAGAFTTKTDATCVTGRICQ